MSALGVRAKVTLKRQLVGSNMINFTENLPNSGNLIEIKEWKDAVESGYMTDFDGIGNWVKDEKMTGTPWDEVCDLHHIENAINEGVTHVIWFNR